MGTMEQWRAVEGSRGSRGQNRAVNGSRGQLRAVRGAMGQYNSGGQ